MVLVTSCLSRLFGFCVHKLLLLVSYEHYAWLPILLGPDKLRIMVLITLSNSIFLVLVHKLLLVVTYEH